MQGDTDIIKTLNQVLTSQLTAINQYFLHARMLTDWGYDRIATKVYSESIRQMKAAQKLTDRILFLQGLPNYQKLLKLTIGETVKEVLANDLSFTQGLQGDLTKAIELCLSKKEHVSREMLEAFLEKEQTHLDWLEQQHSLITEVGLETYLAEQL